MPTFLADTVTGGFDVTAVFDIIVGVVNKIIPLLSSFPFNIFLGASLIGIAVGLFKKLKRA